MKTMRYKKKAIGLPVSGHRIQYIYQKGVITNFNVAWISLN